MVVVVLKAATSFAGIDYNERKNEEGKSELLVAENFAMNPDNLKKSDYIAYMESVCRTNPAVKAKQFHAVISCKGREYSAEDLKNVALQYINKMGYGNNPYMIYFHSDTELQTLMKDKFGINLVFHTGKGHTKPYGYTLIDYRNKRVLKGGEVMDLKELLVEPNKQAKVEHCNSIINLLLKDGTKYTMDSFKKLMLDYGYRFSMNGTIFINGDDKALLVLDKKLLKELRYNSRVYEANKFNVATLKEAELLSRIYHVKKDDILIQEHMDKKNTVYTDMINSYLAHSSDLHSTLREKGILFVEDDNLVYLIDKKNKVIVSTDDLGINIIKDGYSKDRITLVTLDKMERINVEQDSELARGFNLIDAICDILSQHINVQQDKSPNRKKKRGQQQN